MRLGGGLKNTGISIYNTKNDFVTPCQASGTVVIADLSLICYIVSELTHFLSNVACQIIIL